MRTPPRALVTACAAVLLCLALAPAPAPAKPHHRSAELATTGVSAAVLDGRLLVTAVVKNKGNRKAKATLTAFRLSPDTRPSAADPLLGTAPLGELKRRKTKKSSGVFALGGVPAGTYHVVACADTGLKVPERRETNNCRASRATVQVGAGGTVTVVATAGTGGSVTASAVSGGTCTGTSCTFPTGTGAVTFTPVAAAGYRFGAWTGATCTGQTAGSGGAITFSKPSASASCTATFTHEITVTYTTPSALLGSVTGAATNGECTDNALTGGGSCVVAAGVGTVTLTAASLLTVGWGGGCSGSTNPYVLTAPTADVTCTATFSP